MSLRWRCFLLELPWMLIYQFWLQNWVRHFGISLQSSVEFVECKVALLGAHFRWIIDWFTSEPTRSQIVLSKTGTVFFWYNNEFRKSEFVPIPILTNSARLRIGIQSCCQHCSQVCRDATIDHICIFPFLALVRNLPSFLISGTIICVS